MASAATVTRGEGVAVHGRRPAGGERLRDRHHPVQQRIARRGLERRGPRVGVRRAFGLLLAAHAAMIGASPGLRVTRVG